MLKELFDIKNINILLIDENKTLKEKLENSKNKIDCETKETLDTNENGGNFEEVKFF